MKLRKILVADQKRDGRWENDSARMREDDPLIATCFAITALAELKNNARKSTKTTTNGKENDL